MSELKAGVITTPHNEGMSFDRGSDAITVTEGETEFYLKSEADKVIAELEEKLDIYKRGWMENDRVNANQYAEIRHHKYKRCLAMALVWFERAENSTDWKNELVSRKRFSKWMELAYKF